MQNMKGQGAAPRPFSQPSPESPHATGAARPREGVGSSNSRVSAAMKMARALKAGAAASPAPPETDSAEETFTGLEQVYAARREREFMFEQQARRLEAMLLG